MNKRKNHAGTSDGEPLWKRARRRAIERKLEAKRPPASEYASMDSYAKRLERQREYALWLLDQECDWLLTINSNDPRLDYQHGRVALKKLGALLDRAFLGEDWSRFESSERTLFFAIPEHSGGELHYHIMMKLPLRARRLGAKKLLQFRRSLTEKLQRKRIFPSGDAHVRRLTGFSDMEELGRQIDTVCYVVKDLHREDHAQNLVISSEFHSHRAH